MKKHPNLFRVFGIILFVYILLKIDIAKLTAVFKEISVGYYLISILFLIIGLLVRAFKWKRLIDSVGVKVSAGNLLKIMLKGTFLGIITPGRIGEFWRAEYLSHSSAISLGRAFYTAFMDRLTDLLVAGLIAFPALLIIYSKFEVGAMWQPYFLIFIVITCLFIVLRKKTGLRKIFKMLTGGRDSVFLAEFEGGFGSLKAGVLLESLAYSFFYYVVAIAIYYFTALSLGISVPFWYLFLIAGIIWITLTLPLTFFGLGVREAGFIYFFSLLGIPSSSAVAFSLLVLFSTILTSSPGAIFFIKNK